MRNFRNWDVWLNSRNLVKDIYSVTLNFPKEEKFGLTSQIRRSAVSIPANIAEGAGRRTDKDFRQFLYNASGSSFELETLILLANDLKLLDYDSKEELLEKMLIIQKQLNNFIKKLA